MAGSAPAGHGGDPGGIEVHPAALAGYADAAHELTTELHRSSAHDLTTTAISLASGTAVVDNAITAVHTGRTAIQDLLDDHLGQAKQTLGAAMDLLDAGQHGVLIGAAGRLAALADSYLAQADIAYGTAHGALTAAARHLTALEENMAVARPRTTAVTHRPDTHRKKQPHPATRHATAAHHTARRHRASSQRGGQEVPGSRFAPGDLVVFSGHVTLYLGKGHVIAAPRTGTDVRIEPLCTHLPGDPFLGCYRPSA